MSKTYRFRIPGDLEEFISKARDLARENGVTISEDSNWGSVKGAGVGGEYRLEGATAVLVIKQKPFLAPWRLVKKRAQRLFRRTTFAMRKIRPPCRGGVTPAATSACSSWRYFFFRRVW
ncbi:MAG: hypothetical protein V1789_10915 [PVC group bacterium]